MDATTARLVDFALQAEYSSLPAQTVHECKRRFIDTLACAVGGFDEPLSRKARAVAQRYSGVPAASVLGCAWNTSPEAAAFANGVMMRCLDMMDTYLGKTRGHPSDAIAGILGVGETVRADGAAVINAITLAYDVYCTFCDAIDINSKGWDQPVCGVLACVLGVGKLLRLSREQMANAVALALVPNMALFRTRQGELSHWKGCAAANGSRNAVFAALLAQDGFSGPTEVFEGKHGLWDAVGRFDWQLPDPGAQHRITQTHMKCFPVAYHAQSVAWAGIDIRERLRMQDISAIQLETYRLAVEIGGSHPSRWAPKTRESADHSLPYALAIALLDGEITTRSFSEERLQDPAVGNLMDKVKVTENAELSAQFPAATPCRLTVRLSSGEEVVTEIRQPKGHANNPLSDGEVEEKFRRLFRGYGDGDQCEAALHELWRLDRCPDIGMMWKLFSRTGALSDRDALSADSNRLINSTEIAGGIQLP